MSSRFLKNNINLFVLALFLLPFSSLFAQEAGLKQRAVALKGESKLNQLQQQARLYRQQGIEAQNAGKIQQALSFYQKAAELDPNYSVVLNDLGVLAESTGRSGLAEVYYLRAIKADQYYLSSYSNLALLYEGKRDLDRAAFYWKKRIEYGLPDDPWTERAKERLNDLAQISPDYRKMLEESETISLMRQVAEAKLAKEKEERQKAEQHFKDANRLFRGAKYNEALAQIRQATALDPQSQQKVALGDKIEAKIQEQQRMQELKERRENTRRMRQYFEYGIKDYQSGSIETAIVNFRKILELARPPQEY